MKFTEWNFDPRIQDGIREMGFEECTPVQEQTFSHIMEGKDIQAQSQTGTGKTAAFIISAFHLLLTDETLKGKKVLVVAPTRELADQIEKEAKGLGKHLDFKVGSFYGGVGYKQQEDLLKDGVDIIIGTPGRLLDFEKSKKIDFKEIGILVVDEADRLFDMGFYPDIRKMLGKMPPREKRKSLLFSATLNSRVANLSWEYMNDTGDIVIEPENVTVDKISQELYHTSRDEKMSLLLGILKRENPESAIIFTNTKHDAVKLHKRLGINGYKSEFIIGDLNQKKRLKIIEQMKEGNLPILVATDVAARGLHVDDLDIVINYDLPNEAENYVHRIGRTARAGSEGKAISLACEKYVFGLKDIEDYIEMKIPLVWPKDDDLVEDKSAGMAISGEHRDRDKRGGSRDRGGRERGSRDRGGRAGRGGKRELIPSSRRKRSQDLVSSATGASAMEGEKAPKDSKRRDRKKPQNRKKSSRENMGVGKKPTRENNPPPELKKGSLEDRLAYYKKKYGDDFKALEGDKKSSNSNGPSEGKRKRSRNRGKGQNAAKNIPQNQGNQKPADNKNEKSKKKTGFFGKLFGWMGGTKKED